MVVHPGWAQAEDGFTEPDANAATTGPQPSGQESPEALPPDAPSYQSRPARRTGSRIAFWSLAAVAVGGIGVYVYGGVRVTELEQDKIDAVKAYQDDTGQQLSVANVCTDVRVDGAMAGDHPELLNIDRACTSGRQWVARSKIAGVVGLLGIGAAAYFLYRGYLQDPEPASAAVITPIVTDDTVGASVLLRF